MTSPLHAPSRLRSDANTAELAERLRGLLLPGRRTRVSSEVEAWAERSGTPATGDALLAEYNAAFEEADAEARRLLAETAQSGAGKLEVIGLLNRQGTSDQVRVLALETLERVVAPADVSELARVSVNQRAAAIPKTLDVLSAAASGEAAFVLRRVFGEAGNGHAEQAREHARRIAIQAPVFAALRAGHGLGDYGRDALFAALALDRLEQAELRKSLPAGPALETLQSEANAVDAELAARGRESSGLSPYESILRRELHVLALLAGLDADDALWTRASDTLFSADVGVFATLAPLLPPVVVQSYFERATTDVNRRKRPDRAAEALRAVPLMTAGGREEARPRIAQQLTSPDEEVRFEAAVALAASYGDLTAEERTGLQRTYGSLSTELQRRLAPHIGAVGEEIAETGELDTLIRWGLAAPDDEVEGRLDRLVLLWSEDRVAVDAVAGLARAVGELLDRLPGDTRPAHERRAMQAALSWLRKRRAAGAAIRELRAWTRFPELVAANSELVGEALPRTGAQRLLEQAVAPEGRPERSALTALVSSDLPASGASVLPRAVLARIARSEPDALDNVFRAAHEAGQRLLLAASLEAHRDSTESIGAIELALAEQSTQALMQRRQRVLAALNDAEQASRDNQGLQREFAVIRRALAGVDPDRTGAPSDAVSEWRIEAAARLPDIVDAPSGGRVPLQVSARPGDETELANLMMELDQRAHARGTVPASDRPHYRADLQACARAFVGSGAFQRDRESPGSAAKRRSPELARMLEEAWAAELGAALDDEIVRALAADAASTHERNLLRELQVLAARAGDDSISKVAGDPRIIDVETAWRRAHAVVRDSARRRKKLEGEVQRQEQGAMARIADHLALPFQAIESYLFAYFRLRQILAEAGWDRATSHLGAELSRDEVSRNLDRFEIRGEGAAERFLVRSLGIRVGDDAVHRAIVEGLTEPGEVDVDEGAS